MLAGVSRGARAPQAPERSALRGIPHLDVERLRRSGGSPEHSGTAAICAFLPLHRNRRRAGIRPFAILKLGYQVLDLNHWAGSIAPGQGCAAGGAKAALASILAVGPPRSRRAMDAKAAHAPDPGRWAGSIRQGHGRDGRPGEGRSRLDPGRWAGSIHHAPWCRAPAGRRAVSVAPWPLGRPRSITPCRAPAGRRAVRSQCYITTADMLELISMSAPLCQETRTIPGLQVTRGERRQ
jgi:hypothetical protein